MKGINLGDMDRSGCLGYAGKAIPLIFVFLAGVVWSANQYYQQPWHHFYLPAWAAAILGGLGMFIVAVVFIALTTAANTAAIWAAGLSGQRQARTYSIETQDTIREVAGTTRAVSTQNAMLQRENAQLRRQLEAPERPALPAPEEPRMVRFDPAIIHELEAMDAEIVDGEQGD